MVLYKITTEVPTVTVHNEKMSNEANIAKVPTEAASNEQNIDPTMSNNTEVTTFGGNNAETFAIIAKVILLLGYAVYFVFAVRHHVGDEGSWRLIGCTILAAWVISWNLFKRTSCYTKGKSLVSASYNEYQKGKRSLIVRWILYVCMTVFACVYVVKYVALETPANLRSLIGLFGFPFILFLYSNNRRKINWHTVYWAMALQFIMALLILKTRWGASIIRWCGTRLAEYISSGKAGSTFIFGKAYVNHMFAFGSMVQIFVLIVGMSVLTYLGVIKYVVETVGRTLSFCLGTSPPEGINAVGNVFFHLPESAMLVQEYLVHMTPSQLFVTYSGGLATVGGVALVIFMSFGVPAPNLIAASAMSAPAALACCKLAFPSYDEEEVPLPTQEDELKSAVATKPFLRKPRSIMDAIILGINQSVTLAVQMLVYMLTFVLILEVLNNTLIWFGDRIGVDNMTVEFLLSYLFYPFAFMMGARHEDCLFIGELLGIRTFSMPVVAFPRLGPIIQNGISYREYVAESTDNTWTMVGKDIVLDNANITLVGGIIDERSEIIATYSLCGSASFAIMGLIIGSFDVMIPHRIEEITKHIVRSMIVGTFACYLTACFAGLLY